ncbi:DNA repair protein RecN [Anaerosporobacter faecicola]|uniref:DNA repair protein RecN n=1 Tax=Anaerosporobacter faecicola TaxID=2718714 RepID=UPI0038BC01DD
MKNLAIIDEVEVYFSDNLNILTGETGAGKSIIIGSINIALGGKVPKDIIRKGADYALVELVFQVEDENCIAALRELDVPMNDHQVIISRKIMNGRSVSKVNGEIVPTTMLKDISSLLIDIHGQHEHQSLIHKRTHLNILDRYAKEEIKDLKHKVNQSYQIYRNACNELNEASVDEDKRNREISFLEYEINEIENARLVEGEDEELSARYKKLANANSLVEGLSEVYHLTGEEDHGSVSEALGQAAKILSKLESYDEEVSQFTTYLSDVEDMVREFNRNITDYLSGMNVDREELNSTQERLDFIHNLKSKYGNTITDILKYYEESKIRLDKYLDYDNYISRLRKKVEIERTNLEDLSYRLSEIRKRNASKLVGDIKEALIDLNFLDVQFDMIFDTLSDFSYNGIDDAEFLISTNPGEDLKPLGKIASGGELSRIMLAIKSILANNDAIETLIFDEIDVGVSGRTAQKVSEKLAVIAKNHQILCITHLPQIASMADEHYIIEKKASENSTSTMIRKLKEDESIQELARMLSGAELTDTVLQNAREMKELASNTKKY